MNITLENFIEQKLYNKFYDNIETLKKIAKNSRLQHKHSACLMKHDKIITIGYNKYVKENNVVRFTIHAEIDALCKLDKKLIKGHDILIIRISKSCNLKNSRPCNSCIEKLKRRCIRKVYYSNEYGNIVCEFLEDMHKLHVCSGDRFRFYNKHVI
jgi:deoxycytidylate deaminase